ncbi:MAG: precorrin-8X methylmutase [Ferrimicrobium sp.]|jgi:precorrin-8X/cobalt-precorrin-8 methylmutase|nr:precorrin-8X methylmutase [Ferrimicrobium sp.]
MSVSPIELESFARIQREVDFRYLGPEAAEVAARIIHATGDIEIINDLVIDEEAIERSIWGLRHQVPIIVDVRMVAVGIPSLEPLIAIDAASATEGQPVTSSALGATQTRSYRGMKALLEANVGRNPLIAIGSAPTALRAVLALTSAVTPLAVIGMPVGFVDAVESKAALRHSTIPSITSVSRRGGSPMASATVNALVRIARGEYRLEH